MDCVPLAAKGKKSDCTAPSVALGVVVSVLMLLIIVLALLLWKGKISTWRFKLLKNASLT